MPPKGLRHEGNFHSWNGRPWTIDMCYWDTENVTVVLHKSSILIRPNRALYLFLIHITHAHLLWCKKEKATMPTSIWLLQCMLSISLKKAKCWMIKGIRLVVKRESTHTYWTAQLFETETSDTIINSIVQEMDKNGIKVWRWSYQGSFYYTVAQWNLRCSPFMLHT